MKQSDVDLASHETIFKILKRRNKNGCDIIHTIQSRAKVR